MLPYDPKFPVVCFDETPRQLIGEARVPIRAEPGKPRRVDYEYVRNGTANVFMFVDGLANNRGLVRQPWTEYRDRANALFKFHVLLALFNYLISIAVMALLLFLAQSDIQSLTFTNSSITAIVVAVLFFLPYGILMVILNLALRDFVMPAMYLRNVGVLDAWQIARAEVISGNAGSIILFYLMRFLLGIAAGVITVVVTLITCCILGCIPFIWAVVFLPLLAFDRLYLMCFLEQFGPNWKFFKDDHTVEIQPMYMEPALDVPPAAQPPPPAL